MARYTSVRNETKRLEQKFNVLVEDIQDEIREGMVYTTRAGIREARKLIELRGTQGSKDRFAGKYLPVAGPGNSAGRNDTGAMSDAVSADVYNIGSTIIGEVGWLDDFKKYFEYQEEGFENWKAWDWRSESFRGRKTPTYTEGMFIWRDVFTLMAKIAPGQITQAVQRGIKKTK